MSSRAAEPPLSMACVFKPVLHFPNIHWSVRKTSCPPCPNNVVTTRTTKFKGVNHSSHPTRFNMAVMLSTRHNTHFRHPYSCVFSLQPVWFYATVFIEELFRLHVSFRYMLQARLALNGSGYLSQRVQSKIAKFVNCTTRLFAGLDGCFCLYRIFNN